MAESAGGIIGVGFDPSCPILACIIASRLFASSNIGCIKWGARFARLGARARIKLGGIGNLVNGGGGIG